MTVSVIIDSLSNEDGNGIENVTQKVNSRRFKLHRSYCNSFNSSNVGVFFSRVEFYKGRIYVHKKKKKPFFFSFLVFCFVLFVCLFFFGRGGIISIILGKKGGTLKMFWWRGGNQHILQELFFKSHQPPLPHKKWTFPKQRGPHLKSGNQSVPGLWSEQEYSHNALHCSCCSRLQVSTVELRINT